MQLAQVGNALPFASRAIEEEESGRGSRVDFGQSRAATKVSNAIRFRRRVRTLAAVSQKDLTRISQDSK
jgi:hypothetical protein